MKNAPPKGSVAELWVGGTYGSGKTLSGFRWALREALASGAIGAADAGATNVLQHPTRRPAARLRRRP